MLLSLLLGAALTAEAPKLPYVDKGACPFECCTYRDWKAEKPITLHAEPSLRSPIVAKIAAGITVAAETGAVITSSAGTVQVLKPMKAAAISTGKPSDVSLKRGDVIYTLHGVGEGYVTSWYRGKVFEADLTDDTSSKTLTLPDYVWWAKIKTRDGKIGWTDQTRDFSNTDACG